MSKDKKQDSKKESSVHLVGKCPTCGKSSYHRWILNENYGLCLYCGKKWVLKKSAKVTE